ncbi:BPI fold-containing family B member 2 [Elgaria multicarinata webbii]|uniref:BPI fold-containing family B member 2 n=1 Tax=Elgaria multicarinata webbii TaxID=159646 RepID=UPI002FCCFA47
MGSGRHICPSSPVDAMDLPFGSYGTLKYQLADMPTVRDTFVEYDISADFELAEGGLISIPNDTVSISQPPIQNYSLCQSLHPAFLNMVMSVIGNIEPREFNCTPDAFSGAAGLKDAILALIPRGGSGINTTTVWYLNISLLEGPVIDFANKTAVGQLLVQIEVFIKNADGPPTSILSVRDSLKLTSMFSVMGHRLILTLSIDSHDLRLVSSSVGISEVASLLPHCNSLLGERILPLLSGPLGGGIPLPRPLRTPLDKAKVWIAEPNSSAMMQKMFKVCILSILFPLIVPSQGTNPGTVVRVNQEALEYVCQEGRPSLLRGLSIIKIPQFVDRGTIFQPLLNFVGINILKVELPHLSLKLIPKTGVQLSFSSQFHMRVNLLISPLELKLGSSIMLDIRVTRSPHGFPVLSITACKSLLGDIQIIVRGKNLFGLPKLIQDHIRAVLIDKMCLSVSNTVLGLNAKLGTLVGLNTINPMSQLQYAMLETPEITSDYIDVDLNAAFALMGKPIDVSSPAPAFSLPPQERVSNDPMVTMGISEHLFMNLFSTLGQSGAFNLNIGGQSSSGGFHLTRSMLESAMPSIAGRYPQDAVFGLNVVLSRHPIISLQEGRAVLRLSPAVQVVAASFGSSSQSQILCTLDVDLSLALKMEVKATSLQISVALEG